MLQDVRITFGVPFDLVIRIAGGDTAIHKSGRKCRGQQPTQAWIDFHISRK
jgi:hypothetical protein